MSAPTRPGRRRWIPRWLKVVLPLLLVPALVYGFLAWRYWGNPPRPTRNYVAEYNAQIAKIPEDQRAWPLYRDAYRRLEPEVEENEEFEESFEGSGSLDEDEWNEPDEDALPRRVRRLSDLDLEYCYPGGRDWTNAVAFLREHQEAISDVRAAAQLPHLGYMFHLFPSPSDSSVVESEWPKIEDAAFNCAAFEPAQLSEINRALCCDASLALLELDDERATNDMIASLNIADHFDDAQLLLGDVMALRILHQTTFTLAEQLENLGHLFADEELDLIESRLLEVGGGRPKVRIELARTLFDDLLQRGYADEGRGRVHFGDFERAQGLSAFHSPWEQLAAPMICLRFATGREAADAYDVVVKPALLEFPKPFWAASFVESETRRGELESQDKYRRIMRHVPDVAVYHQQRESVILKRDVALTAIALERFRRANGRWPQKLDELMPTYLATVPPDRFDGQSLRYRLIDGRPTVYSVGWDHVDDGGRAAEFVGRWDGTSYVCRGLTFSLAPPHQSADLPQGDWVLWQGAPPPSRDDRTL